MRHLIIVLSIVLLVVVGASTALPHVGNSTEPHHSCVHDSLSEKISSIIAPQTYSQGHQVEGRKVLAGKVSVGSASVPSATTNIRPAFQSMRINVDTSLLLTDEGNTCYSTGQFAKVGKPSGPAPNPACGGSRNDDCWKKCEEADVLTKDKATFITDKLIPLAVDYLQKVIKTSRMKEALVLPAPDAKNKAGTCAEHINIPESYYGDGIADTDLALIVTARPTAEHTIAWAIECASDQLGRPVFGLINVGPTGLKNMDNMIDYYFRVIVHEMTHVLGFNSGKFNLFVDPNTGIKYRKVTSQSTTSQGVTVDKIVTPKALAAAREHFGCPSLDGVLLEDGGGHSTSKSHWEKRVFRNEYMTGTADQHSVFSKITLAFLEDMGWYEVDYGQAEYLDWGKSMGCSFVTGSCKDWRSYGYFCDEVDAKSCTSNRNSIGYCNLAKKSRIPSGFRYFSNQNLGGNDELADFCPYVQAYTNGLCTDVHNKPSHIEVLGSAYGPNSKCFESSLSQLGYTVKEEVQPLCYNYRCSGSRLEVQVGSDWYNCPYDGRLEDIAGYNGVLKCPDRSFCSAHDANVVSHSPSLTGSRGGSDNGQKDSKKTGGLDFNYDLFFGGDDVSAPADNGFNFFGSSATTVYVNMLFVVVFSLLVALYI